MNIAIIVRKLSEGGTQRQALHLAIELQERGHYVTVYALRHEPGRGFADLIRKVHLVVLPQQRTFHRLTLYFLSWVPSFFVHQWQENRDAYDLARLIDPKTELLNPHHDPAAYKTAHYFKKYVRSVPSVWMMNDLTTKVGSLLRSLELYGKQYISPLKRLMYWLFDVQERIRFLSSQDSIAVLDNRDRDWTGMYLKKNAIVVRSGIDMAHFSFRHHEPPTTRNVRILMVGIFFTHRRFEDAIEAIYVLKNSGVDIALTIIGDFDTDRAYADATVQLVHDRGLDHVISFLGRVGEQDLLNAYEAHDIFLFPSHLQSWGLAVFEAMASGLPVIVSQTAGASEILTNGENAIIVPPKSPAEIAQGIRWLCNDADYYMQLAARGRSFVEKNVSWQQYADAMLNVFNHALSL